MFAQQNVSLPAQGLLRVSSSGSPISVAAVRSRYNERGDFLATTLPVANEQRSAITDSLTGVYNARFFHEVLGRETARADRYSTPLSLLMIDADRFKLVNDTFGHVVGNKVLTQIAKTLEHTVRNTDLIFLMGYNATKSPSTILKSRSK
jgi:PleD family two-component response regulator